MKIINLTREEYVFLANGNFLNDKLKEILKIANPEHQLIIDESVADEIRDSCGEYLQIVGFDKNYELTPKGIILENLIDKFFVS